MGGGDANVFLGPGIALGAVGLLSLVLRWIYGSGGTPASRPRRDFGLLVPVLVAGGHDAAEVRARLRSYGIRATTARTDTGGVAVLVFPDDAVRARRLLAAPTN